MLRSCVIDFQGSWEEFLPLAKFSYNNNFQSSIQIAPYEALYGKKCPTLLCWAELGEKKVLGLELVAETKDKVSPWKKVLRFGCNGKLSPRFIGSYQVLRRVRLVAYQLDLPSELDRIYDVFHMSVLRLEEIELWSNLSFEEEPVQILDCRVKVLRRKIIPLVKLLWRNHGSEEAIWEPDDFIHQQYLYLLELGTVFLRKE
ncbi:reverse transcriptase [Gossypium australe]|uniref:Reverse transcriptase n=1 Tax=Gossypium australe TaxID=47621 RepID=A0A5B6VF72_9ROSI|nr:reverse transcriptase [Gossypium australe]